jgi:farnesol dehydrogenase
MQGGRVFVTGGTGFLGGALLEQLFEQGYAVRALARRPEALPGHPQLEVVPGDLSDAARLAQQMNGCHAILHCAALVSTWERDESEFYRVNLDGFRNILTASRKAEAQVLLYTSTFFALGPVPLPGASEGSGLRSHKWHPYQHSKFLARVEARQALASGYPIIILYPGVIYGPGKRTQGNLVVQIIADFLAGRVPALLGDGSQIWSYAYVQDVARGYMSVLRKFKSGGEFVLGGDNVSLRDFFGTLGKLVGKPAPRLKVPIPVGMVLAGFELALARGLGRLPKMTPATVRMMGQSWACDSERARCELSYDFRSLGEGLRETLEWMRGPGARKDSTG